jgi:two-component system, OmpR family, sensor histidine kinase MtrB
VLIGDVSRLRTLVDELLEISRLDDGTELVQRRLVDVRSFVTALLRAGLGGPGWGGWRADHADHGPRRVERILAHLVGNAVVHSDRDVGVRIAPMAPAAMSRWPTWARVSRPSTCRTSFERFYNADSAQASAGSGLGLAIARENAGSLGGITAFPVTCGTGRCSG